MTLVAEVVSPSTKKNDRLEKPAAFAAAGVERYWRVEMVGVVDPTIYCYELDEGAYSLVATLSSGVAGTVAVTSTVSVTFDPADLTRGRR